MTMALILAFVLELTAFIAFSCTGLFIHGASFGEIIIAVTAFLSLLVFWGIYMAPKAPKKVTPPLYFTVKLCVYLIAAASICIQFGKTYCAIFIGVAVLDETFLFRHNLRKQ